MSPDDPTTELLRRLERGEDTETFLEELEKLAPDQRADVIQALFRRLKGAQSKEDHKG